MTAATLEGKRVLVVGASAGIGRAAALRAVQEGAHVVVTARRVERLADLIAEAGGGVAVAGDVRNPDDCRRIVEEAAATLGAIDLLLYTAGAAPLRYFADTTMDDWRLVLETNVIGCHQVIRAALDSFSPGAVVAVLSSESVGRPYPALGAYASSKAALEESLRAWRTEAPQIRVCCVTQGATVPTDFGSGFDMKFLGEVMEEWARIGVATSGIMNTDDVAEVLIRSLAAAVANPRVGMEHLVLRPPFPIVASSEGLTSVAEKQYG